MHFVFTFIILAFSISPASAQTQQAGADGGKTDEAFQALIAKCDNTDLLVKRGKVRLILGRIAVEEAAKAQSRIDEGFAKCGEGKLEEAAKAMDEAFAIADAASTAQFAAEEEEAAAQEASAETDESNDKPWWKFW
ncbi:MAG: hypothetical protein AAGA76_06855 [Pseudomonadota bacterium]